MAEVQITRSGYRYAGRDYPRVTSIKGVIGSGDALINWAAACVDAEVKALVQSHLDGKLDREGLLICLQDPDLKACHTRLRDRKADYGTLFHRIAEDYGRGDSFAVYDVEPSHMDIAAAFRAWLAEFEPNYIATEFSVISDTHGYMGTCDAICEIGGRRVMIDYKTSKAAYKEFAIQMAAYRYADMYVQKAGPERKDRTGKYLPVEGPYPMPQVDACCVLLASPEGCRLMDMSVTEGTFEAFLAAKRIYEFQREHPEAAPVGAGF